MRALSESDRLYSTPAEVAEELGVRHLYCDPNWAERHALGILDVRYERLKHKWSNNRARREEANCERLREGEWLRRINDLNIWPLLFICGANHLRSFRRGAEAEGIAVNVLESEWDADPIPRWHQRDQRS